MPIFTRHWVNPTTKLVDAAMLQRQGPVLQVEVSIPEALAKSYVQDGKPIPPPLIGFALIDTGASITGVDLGKLTTLGLTPISVADIGTPSGPSNKMGVYACQIAFPGTPIPTRQFNTVTGSQLEPMGYLALIGRDVLSDFQLVYNGVDGFWTLAF